MLNTFIEYLQFASSMISPRFTKRVTVPFWGHSASMEGRAHHFQGTLHVMLFAEVGQSCSWT